MTGDAPQPGETPRTEGNSWSFDPDSAWWRGDGDRERAEALAEAAARPRHPRRRAASTTPASAILPPAHAAPDGTEAAPADTEASATLLGDALDAHAAGVQDTAEALRPAVPAAEPAITDTEPATATTNAATTDPATTTTDPATTTTDPATTTTEPAFADIGPALPATGTAVPGTEPPLPAAEAARSDPDRAAAIAAAWTGVLADFADKPQRAAGEDLTGVERDHDRRAHARWEAPAPAETPELMILPEPHRQRPVPGQQSGLNRLDPRRTAAAEREVKRARMENHPFWLTDAERAAHDAATGAPPPVVARRGGSAARRPGRSATGLLGLIALALVAAFFSWVSAEPFWLAVGHGVAGTATVQHCSGSGVTQRCAGSFTAADGSYRAGAVTLFGVDPADRRPGTVTAARMVDPHSPQAYVGTSGPLVQLRWVLGLVMVLLCGLGIAGLTGARQLETRSARRAAVLVSMSGPVVLLVGFLVATY